MAIIFSLIIVLNVFFGAALLRDPIRPRVLLGAVMGIFGLVLIFLPSLSSADFESEFTLGMALALGSTAIASVGNIVSARNQRHGLPVVQTNAYGMGYGAAITLVLALAGGSELTFEASPEYVLSLLYLAIFGSVIAFGSYLTLLGRFGPDRAAYIAVVFPIVALALSTLFEGLSWSVMAVIGVLFVVLGNAVALAPSRPMRAKQPSTAA